jgi:hypothetical protein
LIFDLGFGIWDLGLGIFDLGFLIFDLGISGTAIHRGPSPFTPSHNQSTIG